MFERFIGIDWSGAKKEFQRGIQVAELNKGDKHPRLLQSDSGKAWSRPSVLEHILSLAGHRTLIGMDFAFSVPWSEERGTLLECLKKFNKVVDLWSFVDEFCKEQEFMYAGPLWRSDNSPLRPYVLCTGHKGCNFFSNRLRLTELAASPRPETVYKIIGAKTVGAGSFAGMRFLHALRQRDKRIAVWPFDDIGQADLVFVEIYPSAFYTMAGQRRPNVKRNGADVVRQVGRAVLEHFGVVASCDFGEMSGDQLDAFVSAAALAFLSEKPKIFSVPDKLKRTVDREGWIFGVPFGSEA